MLFHLPVSQVRGPRFRSRDGLLAADSLTGCPSPHPEFHLEPGPWLQPGGWGWEPHAYLALGGTRRGDVGARDFAESFPMPEKAGPRLAGNRTSLKPSEGLVPFPARRVRGLSWQRPGRWLEPSGCGHTSCLPRQAGPGPVR